MKRRGRKRQQVRWLPDSSGFSQLHFLQLGPGLVKDTPVVLYSEQDLLWDATAGETAFQTAFPNAERTPIDSLIVDHISGRFHWGLEGAVGGGTPDLNGFLHIGAMAAIWIAPTETDPATGAQGSITVGGLSAISARLWNPADSYKGFNRGSFQAEGIRLLFRRTWFFSQDFQSDVSDFPLGSEFCPPPGSYVDIKPKRLLRGQDKLMAGMVFFVNPGVGIDNTGAARFCWTPDLRVAVHNTTRRR